MSRNNLFERGTTRPATERTHLLGYRCYFDDVEKNNGNGPTKVLSGMEVETIVVKNDSGDTLAPGAIVLWKNGLAGTQVDGLATAAAKAAGVVDPFLNAAVPDGEQFHLVVRGPTTVLAHDDAITAGLTLVTQGSGRADAYAADGDSDDALSYVGRAIEASTAQDDKIRAVVDFSY